MTLMSQSRALSMMANWLGGASINRDKKGDKNGRNPVVPVAAEQQRQALAFCIANSFKDDAFGLTPDLLAHLTTDKWADFDDDVHSLINDESAWPIHEQILGLQSSVLTRFLNPATLTHVYDNELRVPADQDYVTLPEVLETIRAGIFEEVDKWQDRPPFTSRKPFISSLRRNLQREYVDRLVDLSRTP